MILNVLQMFFWISIIYTFLVGLVLWNKGRELARISRLTKSQLVSLNRGYHQTLQYQHHDLAKMFLLGVIAILIVAEFTVRVSEPIPRGWLFYTHLSFAIPGLISLLFTYFKFNGIKYRHIHRRLVNLTLFLVVGMMVTGIPLFLDVSGK